MYKRMVRVCGGGKKETVKCTHAVLLADPLWKGISLVHRQLC